MLIIGANRDDDTTALAGVNGLADNLQKAQVKITRMTLAAISIPRRQATVG
jgi:hypothetical protein